MNGRRDLRSQRMRVQGVVATVESSEKGTACGVAKRPAKVDEMLGKRSQRKGARVEVGTRETALEATALEQHPLVQLSGRELSRGDWIVDRSREQQEIGAREGHVKVERRQHAA